MAVQPRLTGIFTFREADLLQQLDLKYRRIPSRALSEICYEDTLKLIKLQQEEGFRIISDGQRLWKDLLRPAYAGMDGMEIGRVTRWYETNGFCLPPLIIGKPLAGNAGNFSLDDYFFKEKREIKATEVTLPGPYTLVSLCQEVTEGQQEELWNAFTTQLQLIGASLPSTITLVEFSEPSLAYDDKIKK